jgi:hypothetical protein
MLILKQIGKSFKMKDSNYVGNIIILIYYVVTKKFFWPCLVRFTFRLWCCSAPFNVSLTDSNDVIEFRYEFSTIFLTSICTGGYDSGSICLQVLFWFPLMAFDRSSQDNVWKQRYVGSRTHTETFASTLRGLSLSWTEWRVLLSLSMQYHAHARIFALTLRGLPLAWTEWRVRRDTRALNVCVGLETTIGL